MSGSYLLDTNIVIALLAGEPPVLARLATADSVFVPAIVLGELYFGAWKSGRAESNLARIDDFAAATVVIGTDAQTSRVYGEIKNSLRLVGRPIPENDIWIAAVARQHRLTLASRDDHFDAVEGLSVDRW